MANTKLGLLNRVDAATLLNGTGGGAPALNETPPYTMAKVIVDDRLTIWKTASPALPQFLDLDLGANRIVTTAAVLGYRPVSGLAVTNVKVYSASAATGYVPASMTLQGTIGASGLPRDSGIEFASVNHRYWRFEFTNAGNPWSVGRLWLGELTDLGGIHSPGGSFSPFENRLETPLPGGGYMISTLGDTGGEFVMPWDQIDATMRDTLRSLGPKRPFLLVDYMGSFHEVFVRNGRTPITPLTSLRYNVNLELVKLA